MSLLILLKYSASNPITFARLESRKRSEVAEKYKSLYVKKYPNQRMWDGDSSNQECADLGNYDESNDHDDARRRLSYYRYLVGFQREITFATQYTNMLQQCAKVLTVNKIFTHDVPADSTCYTEDAADGCAYSNLAGGYSNGADEIDAYIDDSGEANLGHRFGCFNDQVTTFGLGRYGEYGALKVTGGDYVDPEPDMPFHAYPSEGIIHRSNIYEYWSFVTRANYPDWGITGGYMNTNTPKSLKITRLNDSKEIEYTNLQGITQSMIYLSNGYKFRVDPSLIEVNQAYVVEITTDLDYQFKYTVRVADLTDESMTDEQFESLIKGETSDTPQINPSSGDSATNPNNEQGNQGDGSHSNENDPNNSLETGAIVGIVIAVIVVAAVAVIGGLIFYKKKKEQGGNDKEEEKENNIEA